MTNQLSDSLYDIFHDIKGIAGLLAALHKSLEVDKSDYTDGVFLLYTISDSAAGKLKDLLEKLNPTHQSLGVDDDHT